MGDVREFFVVNSFASKPFGGNPAAVVTDANGLDKSTMQKIARQFNLVETVFVVQEKSGEADFHLLYFTPAEELPVAGHPTIAAILALVECRTIDLHTKSSITIRTGAGKQEILIKNESQPTVLMQQPKPEYLPIVHDRQDITAILGINNDDLYPDLPIQPINTGLGHLIVPVKSLAALMKIERRVSLLKTACRRLGVREVQAFTFETYEPGYNLHTRNICPREGLEDPGCGVGNGALGAYLAEHYSKGDISVRAEQGTIVDMPCIIDIYVVKGEQGVAVSIGGTGKVMMKGQFYL
ncbi:PhzF family phenazine biosynthesis protein [Sporomusa malonica]|uniref:Trans-2,3-dihydro-3-hydroxyanthranilate isomerase n=1 Tax=Sporomusa malonica TaxID=112901 RepID=A0A1W2CY54_9FIRM|nr:PhzF family phenazine biosynthesis protein [Sporomusa malonica]SMC89812.1 trans-2,3-dihydro-3-hydroxyanthranilate isomerase [Sporomusa malonica]